MGSSEGRILAIDIVSQNRLNTYHAEIGSRVLGPWKVIKIYGS